ncbi:RhoGAP domain-containing protein 4 [Elsinoe australis]|uniref:RhoGAP domain-containing protein 4 n=1 Tax=Elsinoe australis TaxID=40998 RepID=A0A4U7AMV9_9PEZI|nr:RhoGAP domain-containing protein 4 [Elsinoe australis]
MANGEQSTPVSANASSTPRAPTTPATPQAEAVQSKRDLASWWKSFKRGNKLEESKAPQGIFGVPLHESIRYANVAISLFNDNGESYIYGYVPIVVAKCGVFLKEKATETEGIFRLAGSEKRIKELKIAFDSPDRYGKGLDWTGYTVHDAANILRRYFNQLPEPIIPLDFYERFREPLKNHQQQAVGQMDQQKPDEGGFISEDAIRAYQSLITELPPLNRQLLLYILDLLAVFASKSDMNKMTTPNLAAIFQPGILSHPQHDMAPQEYRLSQDVLIFLIENQDSFLIGMHGTAADEKTVKEVQSGYQHPQPSPSPTAPGRSKTIIGRSTSNASGGTEGGRKFSGAIRRNLSTSSRNSRKSSLQTSGSPAMGSPSIGAIGVHRSNTVPSQRPVGSSPRFTNRDRSDPPTPSAPVPEETLPPPAQSIVRSNEPQQRTPAAAAQAAALLSPPTSLEVTSASSSETTTPLAAPGSSTSSAVLIPKEHYEREEKGGLLAPGAVKRDGSSERSASNATSGSRHFLDIFRQSPGSDGEKNNGRQPRKLQKKRLPGSSLSSAASSANDLGHDPDDAADSVASPTTPNYRETDPFSEARPEMTSFHTAREIPRDQTHPRALAEALRPSSPQQSVQSTTSVTDDTDGDFVDDAVAAEKQEKKRRWRFSHSAKSKHAEKEPGTPRVTPPMPSVASPSILPASTDTSRNNSSAIALSSHSETPGEAATPRDSDVLSDTEEKKKGPMSWIRGKIQERKEKDAEKRAKSPSERQNDKIENRRSLQSNRNEVPNDSRKSTEALRQTSQSRDNPSADTPPVAVPAAERPSTAEDLTPVQSGKA